MPGDEFAVSTDSSGEWIYYSHIIPGEPFADVYKQRIEGGQPILVMPATADKHETSPAFSPDGLNLAFVRFHDDGCTIYLYRFGTETPEKELGKCGPNYPLIRWVSNNEILFIVAEDKTAPNHINKMNITNGQVTAITKNVDGATNVSFALSHDRQHIALVRTLEWKESHLILIDLKTGEETVLKEYPNWFYALAWLDND